MSDKNSKPLVSLVIPAYNEEYILRNNLGRVYEYMQGLKGKPTFEILIINDGSTDRTGELAEEFSKGRKEIRVIHHPTNLDLGRSLRTGFTNAGGEFTITYDMDLSYAQYHIGEILDTLMATYCDVVIGSPYMKGGKITAVPFARLVMSRWANRFMRLAAQEKFHTYTCMVRGYRTAFIQGVCLKTTSFEINPEILYKSMILRANIIEIPAHLDWTEQRKKGVKRGSGIRMFKTFIHSLMAGFIFRPYGYFLSTGAILLLISIYIIGWIGINTFQVLSEIQIDQTYFDDRFSDALGQVFRDRPHAFLVGGITFVVAIQFISLGFISLQSKRYFEEIFNISSTILKKQKEQNPVHGTAHEN